MSAVPAVNDVPDNAVAGESPADAPISALETVLPIPEVTVTPAPIVVEGDAPPKTDEAAAAPSQVAAGSSATASDKKDDKRDDESDTDLRRPKKKTWVGKTTKEDHFTVTYQIWDSDDWEWLPYDPSTYVPPPPRVEDPDNYFDINVRYKIEGEKPELVIANWSKTLISFMRNFVGDDFFGGNPEYNVSSFFKRIKKLKAQRESIVKALSATGGDLDDKRALTHSVGMKNANRAEVAESHLDEYLQELSHQLEVLIRYLDKEFEPILEKLALLAEYGHIEYDFLIYHFEDGQRLSYVEDSGKPMAFVLTKQSIGTDNCNKEWVKLKGYNYSWNGTEYTKEIVRLTIEKFEGTAEVTSLTCQHLTPELEAQLAERGKLYTSLAGVHYKTHYGDRVMVDYQAYEERGGYTLDPKQVIPDFPEKDLCLLPWKVAGFNLAQKSWTWFDVEQIRDVVFDENAWDHLVMDPNTKKLIKALVKVTRNSNTTHDIISDVISGKGGGLIAVLHGPPGTGKTLTAESVAENLRRPLYMVGSSELSTSPSSMERTLKNVLSLATAWDAVLLIDEADVFLEQRSLHEIERNSLVSVALRMLEYHRGVLFLTTNRIKTFDEAFLSRFSLAIKYPELNRAGRYAIWRKFFQLANCNVSGATSEDGVVKVDAADAEPRLLGVSAEDLDELADKPFNGRTIKNLVRTAQALALSSEEPLSAEHVKVVVAVQEKFLAEFAQITENQPA